MKKTFKTMLALMAGAMTFTGCTSDILENTPQQASLLKPMTFTATQESDATRAAIVGTAINWTTGDKISIFDGVADEDGNLAREFALTGGENTLSGTFEGTAKEDAEAYYALYPSVESVYKEEEVNWQIAQEVSYSEGWEDYTLSSIVSDWEDILSIEESPEVAIEQITDAMYNSYGISPENQAIILAYLKGENLITKSGPQFNAGNIEGVTFPAAQTVGEGQSVDPKAMLMIGTSDNTNNIQFKNVCAYLKVTPTFACSSIVLKSNGTESLAGTVTVDYNSGEPTTTATNGTSTVTLSGTIAANSTYYIAVLPATLATGFTVEFKDASNKVIGSKSTAKSVTFARNKVINLGSFNMYPPEGSNGKATRTGGSEVNWVQLWEDGPKFAEYNIGATSATEYKCDYYCWGSSIAQDPADAHNTGSVTLTGADDTATALWGSNWRMPTKEDFQALKDNCNAQWTENYKGTGVIGTLFTGKGSYAANSIFLPAIAACNEGKVLTERYGLHGNYWSSTPIDGNKEKANYLYTCPTGQYISPYARTNGQSIRPVLNEATTGTAKATIGGSDVDVNWVQLWKDGPKFAEYNVGVTDGKAESYGGYYAWGGSQDKVDDHNTGTDELTGADDTATKLWGSNWRMPTQAELNTLLKNCTRKWTTVGGVSGWKFTGKEDYLSNSIFLPAAGYYSNDYIFDQDSNLNYWSSTPNNNNNNIAYYLYFDSSTLKMNLDDRKSSYSVRAVLK